MKIADHPFQYYLLPSASPPAHLVDVHNRTYGLWKGVWESVFKELKVDTSQLNDDFVRQDVIAAICAGSEVAAVHLYSFFSLDTESSLGHRYLAGNYPSEFFEKLRGAGVRTVMSLEYMTVNPAWRKGKSPVHLGSVLVGLGVTVMQHYGIDAAIAPARRDHKVHELAYAFGGEPVMENVINHNVPCDLLAIRRAASMAHADEKIETLRNDLWENRLEVAMAPIGGSAGAAAWKAVG